MYKVINNLKNMVNMFKEQGKNVLLMFNLKDLEIDQILKNMKIFVYREL